MINNQNNFYYIIFYFIGYYGVISCKIKKEAHFRRVTLQKNAFVHAGIIAICMIFVNSLFETILKICIAHQGLIYCSGSLTSFTDCPYDQ